MKLVFQKTIWRQFSVKIIYIGSTLQEWDTFGGVRGEGEGMSVLQGGFFWEVVFLLPWCRIYDLQKVTDFDCSKQGIL